MVAKTAFDQLPLDHHELPHRMPWQAFGNPIIGHQQCLGDVGLGVALIAPNRAEEQEVLVDRNEAYRKLDRRPREVSNLRKMVEPFSV